MKRLQYAALICLLCISSGLFGQKIEIAPVDFNSSSDEFAPTLVQNGRFMYFTSDRDGGQKAYIVERTSGGWAAPDELSDDINDGGQNGSVALTPNGQFVIFAAYDHSSGSEGRTDLYSARKINGEWTDVKNLGPNVNSEYWDSQPSLTNDGRTLYFASDRSGGQGGVDIYVSKRERDGSWSKAQNAGSVVNSSYDEMSPVILADNKTFTYSSNKPGGKGGFDLYYSKTTGAGFAGPQNVGMPINSKYDDMFLHTVANSKKVYFASNRNGGSGEFDIYMAIPYVSDGSKKELVNLQNSDLEISAYNNDVIYSDYDLSKISGDDVYIVNGVIYDDANNKPIGSDIVVTDLRTGQKYADCRSDDETGEYYIILQPGRDYSITAQKDGYLFMSEIYEVKDADAGKEISKDMRLSPLQGGHTRLLIFFDFDKTDLKDQSIPELERVLEFLRDNPDIKIVIEGHTDDVGSNEYNNKLSLDRAESVKKYIVGGGIDGGRIQTKGFGKSNPLIKGSTDEARSKNRRVEMRVI